GWLAGRGPLTGSPPTNAAGRPSLSPGRAAALIGVSALALGAGWVIWQPLRSSQADAAAIDALTRGDGHGALSRARAAVSADPLSAEARWILSDVYSDLGRPADAHRELVDATDLQPSSPATWETLGLYDLRHGRRSEAASALREALRLEPYSPQVAHELAAAERG